MAILEADLKKLQKLTEIIELREHFAAFACVVTGRSWDSINKGISKIKYTEIEVKYFSNNYQTKSI